MRGNLKLVFILIGLVAVTFGAVSLYLIMSKPEAGFPSLAPGNYIGTIDGLLKREDGKPLQLYAHVVEGTPYQAFFAVLNSGWKAQLVTQAASGQAYHAPITITGPNGNFKLTGEKSGNLSLSGEIIDSSNGSTGTWRLTLVSDQPGLTTPGELEQLRIDIVARARVREINDQIKAAEITVSQQKEEIAKLQHFITEGEMLKRNADKKYKDAFEQLSVVQEQVAALKKEADSMVQKLELSQRLTGMGKLISLARKSAERENRWVDSMLRTSVADVSLELDSQVERGAYILDLKNQIAEEHDRVFRLMQARGAAGQ